MNTALSACRIDQSLRYDFVPRRSSERVVISTTLQNFLPQMCLGTVAEHICPVFLSTTVLAFCSMYISFLSFMLFHSILLLITWNSSTCLFHVMVLSLSSSSVLYSLSAVLYIFFHFSFPSCFSFFIYFSPFPRLVFLFIPLGLLYFSLFPYSN